MSICRFWWDGSDVYLYYSDRGVECCGCRLSENSQVFDEDDAEGVVAHLNAHVTAGHVVPPYAFEEFGALHPSPATAEAARDEWRGENRDKYGFLWEDDEGSEDDVPDDAEPEPAFVDPAQTTLDDEIRSDPA